MAIPYVPTTPEEMLEMLTLMREHIPQYTQLKASDEKSLRRVANVNPDWIQSAINTAGASPTLQGAIGMTSDDLRAETTDLDRWSSVEAELRVTMLGVQSANLVRRHRIGLIALQIYTIGKQLLRRPEHTDLIPFVQLLQNANIFGPRRTKKPRKQQPADPTPDEPTATTTE
jgi:hypothetical protein